MSLNKASSLENSIDEVLVAGFMPPSVVVNQDLEVLLFRGSTDLYLTHAPGKASLHILKLVRPELAYELKNALSLAQKNQTRVRKSSIEFKVNDTIRFMSMEVVPLEISWEEPLTMILFTEQEQVEIFTQSGKGGTKSNLAAKDKRIQKLEEELAGARSDLFTYMQEQEAATEELQSANEEVVSANEELQTVNEELETSKEEIESTNEELITTNQELQTRNELLHESYEYAEAIFSTINEPLLILDRNLFIKSANKIFYTLFRVTKEETEGVYLYDLANKEWDIPRLRELLEEIIQKHFNFKDFELEHTFPRIGKKVLLFNASQIIQKSHGEQLTLLAINDITEKKEHELKEKELLSRFQFMVQQSSVGIAILRGEEMMVEIANEAFLKTIGKEEKEFVGKTLFTSIPDVQTTVEPLLLAVLRTGITYYGKEDEYTLTRFGKKEKCYFNTSFQLLRENDGKESGIMYVSIEVTDLVIARKRMEAQALSVQNMLMTLPAFVCILSGPDFVYELANPLYQQLVGSRNLIGKTLLEALPELKGQGLDTLLDEVYRTGTPYVAVELPIMLAHDEGLEPVLRYFNFCYQPMYNENNEIYAILDFGYEVTDQVEAQKLNFQNKALREKELEAQVTERTQELQHANQELVKMNKELQAFTYISSHDMQEPLRKIQTFVSRILEKEHENLSEKGKDYFQRMQSTAYRMQKLIEDLLEYSHANTTKGIFENTDLKLILEDVKTEQKNVIQDKNAVLEDSGLGMAYVIPFQFRQLLSNLIGNALKFSKPDIAPHILLTSTQVTGSQVADLPLSPKKSYHHFCFTDNGIGFEEAYQDRIFEPFQKLHSREEYSGTGIGLAIVKKIVENHQGFISAKSQPDHGASFDIYLPIDQE